MSINASSKSVLRSSILGFSRGKIGGIAIATASILPLATSQAASWSNTATTWPPDASQGWSISGNWTGGTLPVSTDFLTWSVTGTGLIDSNFTLSRFTQTKGGNEIADEASLTVTAGNDFAINGGLFKVDNDGSLTATAAKIAIQSSTFTNVGTVESAALSVTTQGKFLMQGGTFTTVSGGTSSGMNLGTGGALVPDGQFIQSGGATSITGTIKLGGGGTFEISGGSFTSTGGDFSFWGSTAAAGSLGGTISVVGSGATTIKFGGLRYLGDSDKSKATWAFTLDNSANHITKIQLAANGNAGGSVRNGTLDVGLNGGVLLSGSNTMTLIEAPSILATSDFLNAADYEGATAKLWTQSIVTGDSVQDLQVSLTAAADKGTLNPAGSPSLAFDAANYGYVDLAGVDLDNPFTLSLDITGGDEGSLALFENALTAAGITWTAGDGDYELALTLDPATSGGNYFAWDLSGIDAGMGVQGISYAVVPEPSTWIALLGGLGMLSIMRRRRSLGRVA